MAAIKAKQNEATKDPTFLLLQNRRAQAILGITQAQHAMRKQRQNSRTDADTQFYPTPNPKSAVLPNQTPSAQRSLYNPLKRVATAPSPSLSVRTHLPPREDPR